MMKIKNYKQIGRQKRILAIEPLGIREHKNFNSFFLKCLGEIGRVTFVTLSGYLESCDVYSRVDIPESLFQHKSKYGARLGSVRVLNNILKSVRLDDYDVILFLAYENISFSICWPVNCRVFVFEHNNIDNILGSSIKTYFYKHISPNVIHLTFQNHIAHYIREKCGRGAIHIPHPYYRLDTNHPDAQLRANTIINSFDGKINIFSPSGSTPQEIQEKLRKFVSLNKGLFTAVCKGEINGTGDGWEVRPFFKDYDELMWSCDLVFLGGCFNYRVSGVAYEALSYGKPILLFKSPFAMELRSGYPNMVIIVNNVNDLFSVKINHVKVKEEYDKFIHEHSFNSILSRLRKVFLANDAKTTGVQIANEKIQKLSLLRLLKRYMALL